jgi:RNA polymerase sigma-70 factor (ECF subfamily)
VSDRRDRPGELAALFQAQRGRLWGLAYRLTGSAEDADDIVQEAFVRLAERPADLPAGAAGPWLARVATNLGLDALRRRRRRPYSGPWLPTPVDTSGEDPLDVLVSEGADAEVRYGRAESATYAFLLALEALSPRQRAVLLLRDVVGCSVRETADLVAASEGNVRVLHTRARAALADYEETRCIPTPELRERHRAALQRFLDCLLHHDVRGLESLLAESVTTVTDSAGEFTALAAPLAGRARVARLYLTAARMREAGGTHNEIRLVNGLPAVLVTLNRPVRRQAPRTLLRCELDAAGCMRVVHAILAPRKLGSLDLGLDAGAERADRTRFERGVRG